MSKPLNSIYGKAYDEVDLSEITLPKDSVRTIGEKFNKKIENLQRKPKNRQAGTLRITKNTNYEQNIRVERANKKPIKKMQVFQVNTEKLENKMLSFKKEVMKSFEKDLVSGKIELPEEVNAVVIAIENVEVTLKLQAKDPKKHYQRLLEAAEKLTEALEGLSDKKRKKTNIVSMEEMKEDEKDGDSFIFEAPEENPINQLQLLATKLSQSVQETIRQIKKQSGPTLKLVKDKKFTEVRKQEFSRTPQSFGSKINFFENKFNNKSSDDSDEGLSEEISNKKKSEKFGTFKENKPISVTSSLFSSNSGSDNEKKTKISQDEKHSNPGSNPGYNSGSSSN